MSSCESELYAVNKAASEALAVSELMGDLGIQHSGITIMTDASATIGVLRRQGAGKLRHVEVQELWL